MRTGHKKRHDTQILQVLSLFGEAFTLKIIGYVMSDMEQEEK